MWIHFHVYVDTLTCTCRHGHVGRICLHNADTHGVDMLTCVWAHTQGRCRYFYMACGCMFISTYIHTCGVLKGTLSGCKDFGWQPSALQPARLPPRPLRSSTGKWHCLLGLGPGVLLPEPMGTEMYVLTAMNMGNSLHRLSVGQACSWARCGRGGTPCRTSRGCSCMWQVELPALWPLGK